MSPGQQNQNRQTSTESDSDNGETGGKMIPSTITPGPTTTGSSPFVPGFSNEQITSLMTLFQGMLTTELNRRFGQVETQHHTNPVTSTTLRAEEVGFFDPEHAEGAPGPIANLGKYVVYRDVVCRVVPTCLRGTALMWYTFELTSQEKDLLRRSNEPGDWCDTLIKRFKMRSHVAHKQLGQISYGLRDIQFTSPRVFVQRILYLVKAAELESTYHQILMIRNRFRFTLRQHLPTPERDTTLGQFLDQIDEKTWIWEEMAERQEQHAQ